MTPENSEVSRPQRDPEPVAVWKKSAGWYRVTPAAYFTGVG